MPDRHGIWVAAILAVSLTACGAARHLFGQSAERVFGQSAQAPATGVERKTIFIPMMDGYERNIAAALGAAKVPVDIVAERGKAELAVRATFPDPNAGNAINKATGHAPFSWLEVVEVGTNRVVLRYPFLWSQHEETRNRDAEEFAREMKNKLRGKSK